MGKAVDTHREQDMTSNGKTDEKEKKKARGTRKNHFNAFRKKKLTKGGESQPTLNQSLSTQTVSHSSHIESCQPR